MCFVSCVHACQLFPTIFLFWLSHGLIATMVHISLSTGERPPGRIETIVVVFLFLSFFSKLEGIYLYIYVRV